MPIPISHEVDAVLVVGVDEQVHDRPTLRHEDGVDTGLGSLGPVSQGEAYQPLPLCTAKAILALHLRRL